MQTLRLSDHGRPAVTRAARPGGAWREVELLLLVALVVGVYFSRLTDLTIRGEESRWARVAHEMLETGDWIVPRQQGQPFPDRPPLNSWMMILASQVTGELNLTAIRLPSVMATLLTTLLLYLYCRNFLSRVGALAAAAAFATLGQVLQLGRMAESDPLLMLCLTGALFAWHYAYQCRDSRCLAWTLGYLLAALAGLAKGPQGPIYFVAVTVAFLCLRRDWRFLFSRWHLVGLTLFVLVVGAWQLPFLLAVDTAGVRAIWSEGGDMTSRFHYSGFRRALSHWVSYPFEVLACTLPWSLFLPVLPTRWLRSQLGEARPMVLFLLTACAVTFPTCWLPAETRTRYFMALYPCLAALVGLVIERCWESREGGWWGRSWDRFLTASMALMVGAGLFVGTAQWVGGAAFYNLGQAVTTSFAIVYLAAALAAAAAVLWSRSRRNLLPAQLGTLAVAGFLGLTYTGVVMSVQVRTSNNPAEAVTSVRNLIPPGERLISIGPVHHLFAYYYQEPIELQKLTRRRVAQEVSNTYFCFAEDPGFKTPEIPFAWEHVTEISCERAQSDHPRVKVVIGRRNFALEPMSHPQDPSVATWLFPAADGGWANSE